MNNHIYYCTVNVKCGLNRLLIPMFIQGSDENDVIDSLSAIAHAIHGENYKVYGMSLKEMVIDYPPMKGALHETIAEDLKLGDTLRVDAVGVNINLGNVPSIDVKVRGVTHPILFLHSNNLKRAGEVKIGIIAVSLGGLQIVGELPPMTLVK